MISGGTFIGGTDTSETAGSKLTGVFGKTTTFYFITIGLICML